MLYYNKNPGIAYSFVLPNNVPFRPFEEAAPKAEGRGGPESPGRSRHPTGTHRARHNRQRTGAPLGEFRSVCFFFFHPPPFFFFLGRRNIPITAVALPSIAITTGAHLSPSVEISKKYFEERSLCSLFRNVIPEAFFWFFFG